jgi:hypothetical protein
MIIAVLMLSIAQAAYTSEKSPPDHGPSLEAVQKVFGVRSVGNMTFTLSSFSASYLSRWLPGMVIDIDSRSDETGISRVTRIGFRLRTNEDFFFPILRRL